MKKQPAGFVLFEALLFLLVVGLLGFAGWRIYAARKTIPTSPATVPAETPTRVVAIGDVACDPSDKNFAGNNPERCQSSKTHDLLASIKPDAILGLGDLQYENGALDKFMASYDKSWGLDKSKTHPVPGNHEYGTKNATGYFSYFNDSKKDGEPGKGYYSTTIGSWHVIGLNSNCKDIGGCGEGSAQLAWLKQDLANSSKDCTLAFWHHPHFTSGQYANDTATKDRTTVFWQELVNGKADVILNGHDHLYERFALQTADGQPGTKGIRQFTAGTGGKILYKIVAVQPNSQKLIDDQFGVLVLDLYAKYYTWQFKSVSGAVLDSGSQVCST